MGYYYQITALIVRAFNGMGKRNPPLQGGVLHMSMRNPEGRTPSGHVGNFDKSTDGYLVAD